MSDKNENCKKKGSKKKNGDNIGLEKKEKKRRNRHKNNKNVTIIYNKDQFPIDEIKSRYSSLIEHKEYSKVFYEITNVLIKNDNIDETNGKIKKENKTFKYKFQEHYEEMKNDNVLLEFFYCLYKLKLYKKLSACLKYYLENEDKYNNFVNILLADVSYKLRNFETSINLYELLIKNEGENQVDSANINMDSSYISFYLQLMYEYNFLKIKKDKKKKNKKKLNDEKASSSTTTEHQISNEEENDQQNANSQIDIQNLKDKITEFTNNFNSDEVEDFEQLYNYSIFFAIEKCYDNSLKFLDLLEDLCKNTLIMDEVNNEGNNYDNSEVNKLILENNKINKKESSLYNIEMIKKNKILIQLGKAYIYSKMNKIKESVDIYENILNNYELYVTNLPVLLTSYNNYIALMNNYNENLLIDKLSKVASGKKIEFNIKPDKLLLIKNIIFMHKDINKEINRYQRSVLYYNECLDLFHYNHKTDELRLKLQNFSTKFNNSVLLDKLNILTYLKENNYLKCKHYIRKNIDLVQSPEIKIKYINAYAYMSFEKKAYNDVVDIYLQYEHVFHKLVHQYKNFFSNLFYIYICVKLPEKKNQKINKNHENNDPCEYNMKNLERVIDLFTKYKQAIKDDINIINPETLFLVSKYLICNEQTELLHDLFEYLSTEIKNDFNFYSIYTYIYTYINIENVYKYEGRLKKVILSETYMIDVEELENKSISFDASLLNQSLDNIHKKRKRSKKNKNNKTTESGANTYNNPSIDKWLPRHEKPGFKNRKKKIKSIEHDKEPAPTEETKPQPINPTQAKLQNMKQRKKR
ncbi:signal recognition particle subunit SRP72, putative [Plasmodium vinckei brucechwatti]|uniref:Signal recognition particle subunit SRP72, putative n=1 Tax=Plasmodium vinckei brucechwatti TaxID=119398 RepID=A0A6V7S4S3_PLAVN|nr:signal recognition particle subunit SRP72, putative [Plasmodium vinckei brucechwatti]